MADDLAPGARRTAGLYIDLELRTDDSIRVVDVLPGRRDDEVKISLRVVTLRSKPRYEALSYTWGKSVEAHSVRVNKSYDMPVTDNLFCALRALRLRNRIRTIWVDAIAINQVDLSERNQQVKMMGTIYEEASCVNIWLGETGKRTRYSRRVWPDLRFTTFLYSKIWRHPRAIVSILRQEPLALDEALSRSDPKWQERAWTIQEFLLAKHAFLCFGEYRIPFQSGILNAIISTGAITDPEHYGSEFEGLARTLERRLSFVKRQMHVSKRKSSQRKLTILEAANVLGSVRSTNPRDMVYSLLGLISPEEASYIGVDYACPCQQVYSKATFAALKCSGTFDVLHFVVLNAHPGRPKKIVGLPTWCINFDYLPYVRDGSFSRERNGTPLLNLDVGYSRRLRKIGLGSTNVTLDSTYRILSFEGVELGIVADILTLRVVDYGPEELKSKQDVVDRFVQGAASRAKSVLSSPRGDDIFGDAILRALVFGSYDKYDSSWGYGIDHASTDEAILTNYRRKRKPREHHLMSPAGAAKLAFEEWNTLVIPAANEPGLTGFPIPDTSWRELGAFEQYLRMTTDDWAVLFLTANGMLGLASSSVEKGDSVVMVPGAWPFILLKQDTHFAGLVFAHGLTHPSFWERWDGEGYQRREFLLT